LIARHVNEKNEKVGQKGDGLSHAT